MTKSKVRVEFRKSAARLCGKVRRSRWCGASGSAGGWREGLARPVTPRLRPGVGVPVAVSWVRGARHVAHSHALGCAPRARCLCTPKHQTFSGAAGPGLQRLPHTDLLRACAARCGPSPRPRGSPPPLSHRAITGGAPSGPSGTRSRCGATCGRRPSRGALSTQRRRTRSSRTGTPGTARRCVSRQ